MRIIYLSIIFLCVAMTGAVWPSVVAAEEHIPLYEVEIVPHEDSSFTVTETIYYDFARLYKHGITREIPLTHPQGSSSFLKERYLTVDIDSITMDDEPIPYDADLSDSLFLKIGDPNQTVTTEHKYTITYDVKAGLHYYDNAPPELYWDAIGAESAVAIATATITVRDEVGVLTGQSSCYAGKSGAQTSCGDVTGEGHVFTYTVSDLAPYEGVTIAFAMTDSMPTVILERYIVWYFILPVIGLLLIGFVIFVYRYHTAFRTGRSIIAQYEPYADLKPMYSGVLFDDNLHPQDITACIVYLAEQGYVRIKKTERKVLFLINVDDYEITLKKVPGTELSRFQTSILGLLFDDLKEGSVVTLSKLKTDMIKQHANHKTLNELRSDLRKDLAEQGFFQNLEWEKWKRYSVFGIGVTAVVFFIFPPIGILLVIFIIIFLIISRRRTRKGYEALDHLKGFKDFLSVTDKERYKFHNAPQKSPEQFMQYLPYAIAFGVEEEWAKVFKDITIPNPDWYDGGSPGAFAATNLTQSLGAFSTAFAASSGSSGSGSSGGGSVSGGGGGGSVGSW